jgi:pimeloyl-ACP methyl ester carboxylesterase
VAPFLRGYAPSTLRGPFHIDRLAADVLAMVDSLSPDGPVHLLGHDWGAVITHVACGQVPERFSTAVTVSVPHPLTFLRAAPLSPAQLRRSWYIAFFQLPWLPERWIRERGLLERLWRDWSPGFEPPPGHLEEVVLAITASLPAPLEYYRAPARQMRASVSRVAELRRRALRVPTLHLHGRDDGCIGPELAEDQERHFDARLTSVVIDGAGHFVQLERPRRVAELVLEHLASAR